MADASSEPDEATPLVRRRTTSILRGFSNRLRSAIGINAVAETDITKKSSLYSTMIFMPCLEKQIYGHYMTRDVSVGFALLLLSVTLQLSLTWIAGAFLVNETIDSRFSLVQGPDNDSPEAYAFPNLELGKGLYSRYADEEEACCDGAYCVGLGMKCCGSHAAHNHTKLITVTPRGQGMVDKMLGLFQKPGRSKAREESAGAGVTTTHPLCYDTADALSCLPPSAALLDSWAELDHDGDGTWTVDEAREDKHNFGCLLGVPLEDVFRSACVGLNKEADEDKSRRSSESGFNLPHEVRERRAISHGYFKWWMGIVALCTATDDALCGTLLARGAFDGALEPGRKGMRGDVIDASTALAYCQRILQPGGLCRESLPGSYVLFRSRVQRQCGNPSYVNGPRYVNPHAHHDVLPVMNVSYSRIAEFEHMRTFEFKFFLAMILIVWYINLVEEVKDCIELWDFLASFPVENSFPRPPSLRKLFSDNFSVNGSEQTDEEADEYGRFSSGPMLTPRSVTINSITRPHHMVCVVMACCRTLVLVYLATAGTFYLMSNTTYEELLLNALALAFIFDLDGFIFEYLVPGSSKDKLDAIAKLVYTSSVMRRTLYSILVRKFLWGLVLIPIVSFLVVKWNDEHNTAPVLEALRCACLEEGERCLAQKLFTKAWWDRYWADMFHLSGSSP
mmetsp:Transcript_92939/g.240064  ORF Transcript_92939/g.240064 Transcript_92939/m.240064 type:complete len:677 (-) Transcript_92939:100-2130(-)